MKRNKLIILILFSFVFLTFSTISFAEKNEIMDEIVEWSPGGSMIQVGPYTIMKMGTLYIDKGTGKVVRTTTKSLKVGGLVKVSLSKQDDNGFWEATTITALEGKALEDARQSLGVSDAPTKISSKDQGDTATDSEADTAPEASQSKKPRLVDGVWVN